MDGVIKYVIAVGVLFLGIPIGNLLKRYTKEELEVGRPWFKLIVLGGLAGGFIGVTLGNDALMFGFFFMALVASRSLQNTKKIPKKQKKIKKPRKF